MPNHRRSIFLRDQSHLHLFIRQIGLCQNYVLATTRIALCRVMATDIPSLMFWSLVRNIFEHWNKYRSASENTSSHSTKHAWRSPNIAELLPSHHGEECDVHANSQGPWEAALATGKASAEWGNSSDDACICYQTPPQKTSQPRLIHEQYLLRKVGIISPFNSFSPGKEKRTCWWSDCCRSPAMEALVACSASERYIHVSSLAVPYNNADVATLKLKHRVKNDVKILVHTTNSVQNTPASFNGNLMQAYFRIFLISLLRIAKWLVLISFNGN